ncbi:MAG: sensor histidine kinase [Clostridiales bacterium]|nr:sensor histidine kinase [Clostridiales bacterium]
MDFLLAYLKQRRRGIAVFLLCCAVFLVSFALYRLPLRAVLYPMGLCLMLLALFAALDIRRVWRKHSRLLELRKLSAELLGDFPPADSVEDEDYQEIIRLLCREQAQLKSNMSLRYYDMVDYYTVWAHQIKTPIASMRLNLQNEDSEFSRTVAEDLQRIEQYVEMVLAFLRLDSDASDYVIRQCDLDDIVRSAVRKLSTQFIRRRIGLQYEATNASVITDEKWLSFVLEQVLSNALKYTRSGTISIYMEQPKTLCVRDTGIGIAPEDLPRIFEKGYTGYNGRGDKKASGIGLYLCKRICENLGDTITAESSLQGGTLIRIGLEQQKIEIE